MRAGWAWVWAMVWLVTWPRRVEALELPCRYEDALSEAAADMVLAGRHVEPKDILASVRAFGFDGVAVQAHEGQEEAPLLEWLKREMARADGPLVCGEARSGSRWLVLVSARGGRLWRDGDRIRGRLEAGFDRPHLVVEGGDGHPRRVRLTTTELERGTLLPPELDGRRVQLVAEGPSGPRPVAELQLDAASYQAAVRVHAPTDALPTLGARSRPVEALLARLDAFRSEAGALALRSNGQLTRSAQKHAVRVCELGRVGHRLEGGDDPESRLRADHIIARGVGEAIARAQSADDALRAVLDSPSHRLAVSDRRFTDAGIGQALDRRGHTCLVVLLAAWPRRLP